MAEERIGKYVILGEAGRGGMGIVHHARDESLDRDVAIKVLPESVALNLGRMARFQREGKVLASLNHPNIAAIYEVGQDGDRPYVVLEFVEGKTLAEVIRRGSMPWQKMLPIAIQIASAMEYAHEQGVIHRDLKPQNVKFDSQGNAKVLDFGLAKAIGEETENDPEGNGSSETATIVALSGSNLSEGATTPGMMMGTIGYLSPEQACGRDVDKQTDVFSFGCILFEMLTGKAPFASESAVDAIGRTLHKDPEWTQLPETLPPRLKALLQRCLAKEKKDRLRDIGDARLELVELLDHQDELVVQTATHGRSPVLMSITALALLAATAFALLYVMEGSAPTQTTQQPPALLNNRAVLIPEHLTLGVFDTATNDGHLAIVGSKEIYSGEEGGPPQVEWRIYLRTRDSAELREIHLFTGMAGFAFSPDDESYVLNYGGRVLRGRLDSTITPIELARIPNPKNAVSGFDMFPAKHGVIWFDANTIIIEAANDENKTQLVLLDAKTGDVQKTVPLKLHSNELRLDGLIGRLNSDHIMMYVSLYNEEGFSINIASVSLSTGELNVLVERAGNAQVIDEHIFFSRDDSLYMASYDPETHKLLDAGQPVMEGLYALYGSHSNFVITDNGTLVYKPGGVQGDKRRLMTNSGEGLEPTSLPDAPYDNALAVSGDGSQICSTILREDGMWEVWGGTVDPPRMRKIMAENDADYCYPLLSYDGAFLGCVQIATTSEGVELAYVVGPVDGSTPKKTLWNYAFPREFAFTCFSLDNTRLLGDTPDPEGTDEQRRLVEMDIETGEVIEVLSQVGGASNGLWSPDGTMISFKSWETASAPRGGPGDLHVYNPKTKETAMVSNIPVKVQRWVEHPDGSLSLIFWDEKLHMWESTIKLDENGKLITGEAIPYKRLDSRTALAYSVDNRGKVYTIEPGEKDGSPNHLVVIENWLQSVVPNDD